ncbi:hypothetical protein KM1_158920 [Entamoeba histolytica HM-3:IMSS]|uniref:Uncharacterized protein n=1 Tax=Entamoeba histolytica HM-3:IMSS TaxID=885315 RepID=M7X3X7_ENTHI|nr:hypothetical protein KM1_158920 [Entamoeba histolytica HM-3:IMSS]
MSSTFCLEEEKNRIITIIEKVPDLVTENKNLCEEVNYWKNKFVTLQEEVNNHYNAAIYNYELCMKYETKVTELTKSLQNMDAKTKEMSEEYTKKEQKMNEESNQKITELNNKINQLEEKIVLLNEEKEKLLADISSAKTRGKDQEVESKDQFSKQNEPKQEEITNETNENTPEEAKELEKIVNEKKSNDAMKIIEKLGGIKALAKNTNLNNMSWSYNPKEDGLFEVIIFCSDKSCSFIAVYNSQEMNVEENQPYCQTSNDHFCIFDLPAGSYEIFAYNDESLENIGYSKITFN